MMALASYRILLKPEQPTHGFTICIEIYNGFDLRASNNVFFWTHGEDLNVLCTRERA